MRTGKRQAFPGQQAVARSPGPFAIIFLGSLGWGPRGFGWSLLPLLFGVAWIVWRPRGLGGWALALLGIVVIGLEVLGSLTFYFRPVSLITVLLMLVPGAVGAGLVLKNL